jgi:hypothetical protein
LVRGQLVSQQDKNCTNPIIESGPFLTRICDPPELPRIPFGVRIVRPADPVLFGQQFSQRIFSCVCGLRLHTHIDFSHEASEVMLLFLPLAHHPHVPHPLSHVCPSTQLLASHWSRGSLLSFSVLSCVEN